MTNTDSRFFTNDEGAKLVDRFKQTLKDVQFFDILVGYFQTSGFYQLYKSFEGIEKIRILVGLGIDKQAFEIIEESQNQAAFDFSYKETRELFADTLVDEIERAQDASEVELGIQKFIEFLNAGKIEIKAHPSRKIHAKVYISRFHEEDRDFGNVITGSSNFSYAGLAGQYEFNVELKDDPDVNFALNKFNELWVEAIDVTEDYINSVQDRTWLNDKLSPYMLYLKTLYEYFREDINLDQTYQGDLPEGFMDLEYQKQATLAALKIVNAYNGVFISDVVGLGKTYISALLAKQLDGGKFILCPPPLKEYWEETFRDFGVRNFRVDSVGKIDQLYKTNLDKYQYIFIDEAHRFRNEKTQTYDQLRIICAGKKVILVTATPFNNTIDDILAQLSLFQVPKRSLIPGVSDLTRYFKKRNKRLKAHDKGSEEYVQELGKISSEIREDILKYIMVRRTRNEIVRFFSKDIELRGLSFPEINEPHGLTYYLGDELEKIFDKTIELMKGFSYSRYTPLLFLKRKLKPFEVQQQKNVRAFMKMLLVKRLESSFHAFKKSVGRFGKSYQRFIEMFDNGTVYVSKKVNVFDYLDDDREDDLLALVEDEKAMAIKAEDFREGYRDLLTHDLSLIKQIQSLWAKTDADPKLTEFIRQLKDNSILSNQKVIIFTEAAETGVYLYDKLSTEFDMDTVMFVHGGGGIYQKKNIHQAVTKQLVRENYDPMAETQKDDLRILITTDVLAEGINLHRSNIVINYDLPWNPTRVLQRVGRVNRVGTKYQTIEIFNYFPTARAESAIGLEDNIKAKIQAFHSLLGEDAKYLTGEEEVESFGIFGDRFYNRLQNVETYTGEVEERSELEYLQIIREIRDENPDLFEKVKRLPKKARTGKQCLLELAQRSLISFIRKGALKKFYLANNDEAQELPFLDAIELIRCSEEEHRQPIPKLYFEYLDKNKNAFDALLAEDEDDGKSGGGLTNARKIIYRLKTAEIKHCKAYTEDDEAYIISVRQALEDGRIPYKTTQRLRKDIETDADPLSVLSKLRKWIPEKLLTVYPAQEDKRNQKREVILSVFLKEGETHEAA